MKHRFIHVGWIRVNCISERNRAKTPNTSLILFACRATRLCVGPLMTVGEHLVWDISESLCLCVRESGDEEEVFWFVHLRDFMKPKLTLFAVLIHVPGLILNDSSHHSKENVCLHNLSSYCNKFLKTSYRFSCYLGSFQTKASDLDLRLFSIRVWFISWNISCFTHDYGTVDVKWVLCWCEIGNINLTVEDFRIASESMNCKKLLLIKLNQRHTTVRKFAVRLWKEIHSFN